MANPSRIAELASIILLNTNKINEYLQAHGLSQPSFDVNGPFQPIPTDNPELEEARTIAVEASIELQQLLQGVDSLICPETNMTSLRAITRFKIASAFGVNDEISVKDLAEKTGLYEHDLSRIIRYAIAHHRVFCEPRRGVVAHSAASRRLAESELMQHVSGLTFEEVWPAHAKTVDALTKFGKSQEPNASGFALANETTLPFYEYLEQHPERAKRFGGAMSSAGTSGLQSLADGFSWSSLPANGLVIDLGGSQGHVSAFLAEKFQSLRFIVQDLPEVISDTKSTYRIPESLKERVTLVAHDFFEVQWVRDVDVAIIRYVFHNWSDDYCVKILRNLIPSLKKGARVVVQDHLLPDPGTLSLLKERQIRSMDMIMLTLFNARERDQDDWKNLFELADPGFKFLSAKRAKENEPPAVIVASWESWAGRCHGCCEILRLMFCRSRREEQLDQGLICCVSL